MRLLLAEDERSLSKALTAILEGNHYSVDTVADGEEALAYLDAGNYDAAILDIMMPRLDGLSVLRRLRAGGNQIPVLLLTAKGEVEDKVLGLDSGANDYLAKPFSTPELLARIRAMTRGRAPQGDALLRMGNLTLNRATFEVSSLGAASGCPTRSTRCWSCCCARPPASSRRSGFWRASGAMTAGRRPTWSGSTSPACGKSWGSWGPTWRSPPPGTQGTIVTAVEKKQMLLFNPGASIRPGGRETAQR